MVKADWCITQFKNNPLSFTSADELKSRIEALPGVPPWRKYTVKVDGDSTGQEIDFYCRDGLEVFESLFSDPMFKDAMEYCPRKVYADEAKTSQVYNEVLTGDLAWMIQVSPSSILLSNP